MTQVSRPLTGADWTDAEFRRHGSQVSGIKGDLDGTAYAITLSPDSDVAQIGSATQESLASVAGFDHWIAAASSQGVTIPAASGGSRTDVIVLRYDPTNTGEPGPVRLAVVSGTTGSGLPTWDESPSGSQDLPLWAVTRAPGQALSQAPARSLRRWYATSLTVPTVADLTALVAPVGTEARVGSFGVFSRYVRGLDGVNNPTWLRVHTFVNLQGQAIEAKTMVGVVNVAVDGNGDWSLNFSATFSQILSATVEPYGSVGPLVHGVVDANISAYRWRFRTPTGGMPPASFQVLLNVVGI